MTQATQTTPDAQASTVATHEPPMMAAPKAQPLSTAANPTHVVITDIKIPVSRLIVLIVKVGLAVGFFYLIGGIIYALLKPRLGLL